MVAIMFDTHAFVKEMTQAGMPEPQAEVLARSQAVLIEDKLVTKEDLKQGLKLTKQELRQELKELELRLTLRLGSMMVVAVGVVAALVKLL